MPADLIHLVRHGEVFNPTGVLYGRLPEFHLSELGRRMAQAAADSMAGRNIAAVTSSPLTRTRESAEPWVAEFHQPLQIDDRLIEPSNKFEGVNIRRALRAHPLLVRRLINPWKPSWGEPFVSIAARMMAAVASAHASVDRGEVVLVSHQLPIWMVARTVQGKPLATDPRRRRCTLSSITTVAWDPGAGRDGAGAFAEVDYQEPAAALLAESIDLGAVNRLTPVALIAVAVSLALAGCTSDSLATDYNSNDATGNYVSPDGATKTIAPADRGSSVTWTGTTDRGSTVSSSDYAGKVVVLNFWYASCPPCRAEASSLEKLNTSYSAKGVVFLGVNVQDTGPTALSFEKAHGVTYPSILDADEGAVKLAFTGKISPTAVPTTLIIDAKGRVAARFSGLITSPSLVATVIDATLAESSS